MKDTKICRNGEPPTPRQQNECADKNTVSDGHVFLNFFHLVEPQPVVGYSRRPVIRTYCAAV